MLYFCQQLCIKGRSIFLQNQSNQVMNEVNIMKQLKHVSFYWNLDIFIYLGLNIFYFILKVIPKLITLYTVYWNALFVINELSKTWSILHLMKMCTFIILYVFEVDLILLYIVSLTFQPTIIAIEDLIDTDDVLYIVLEL